MDGRRRWRPLALVVGVTAVGLVVGACSGPDRAVDASRPGQPTELRWRKVDDAVICDGTERKAGTVEQADGSELIEFTTPLPIEVPPGRADGSGHYPLAWTCQPEEAQLRWALTATGAESGRSVELIIVGAPSPVEQEPIVASLYDGAATVMCDGTEHEVGEVAGLDPLERVRFESEHGEAAAKPRADDDGNLVFGWRCRPGDVDQTWPVTVSATDSERTTSFTLTGLVASDVADLAIESAETEIVCDGLVHPLATVVNLFPFETVSFSASPAADDLRDGTADGAGRLDLRWQCDRGDAGRTWSLTATASETGETIALRFSGIPGPPQGSATARLLDNPFVCDGHRHPVAELTDLAEGEFVDFSSPDTGPLLEGRFERGSLTVHWQCAPDDLDGVDHRVWSVTATGRESGRTVTFTLTGVGPPPLP